MHSYLFLAANAIAWIYHQYATRHEYIKSYEFPIHYNNNDDYDYKNIKDKNSFREKLFMTAILSKLAYQEDGQYLFVGKDVDKSKKVSYKNQTHCTVPIYNDIGNYNYANNNLIEKRKINKIRSISFEEYERINDYVKDQLEIVIKNETHIFPKLIKDEKIGVEVYVWLFKSTRTLVFAYRGSESWLHWLANLQLFRNSVEVNELDISDKKLRACTHGGFHHQFVSVFNEIEQTINKFTNYYDTIIHTGHSRGGALATISAQTCGYLVNDNKKSNECYTYGSPRIGNDVTRKVFLKYCKQNYRFITKHDLVPMFPNFGFIHVNDGIQIDTNILKNNDNNGKSSRIIKKFVHKVKDLSGFPRLTQFIRLRLTSIRHHEMKTYIDKLYQILFDNEFTYPELSLSGYEPWKMHPLMKVEAETFYDLSEAQKGLNKGIVFTLNSFKKTLVDVVTIPLFISWIIKKMSTTE